MFYTSCLLVLVISIAGALGHDAAALVQSHVSVAAVSELHSTIRTTQIAEGAASTASRHTASSSVDTARLHGKVLYVVYSDSLFYKTRVSWILKTWASELPKQSLVIVGDEEPHEALPVSLHKTRCPPHSHWEGACCKYAEAVVLAHTIMQRDRTLQWAFFTDDDAYIRPGAMESALRRHTQEVGGHGVVLGTWGCVAGSCNAGLCAGGGYAASFEAVEQLVGGNVDGFLEEQMHNCARCERWADVSLSQIFVKRGLVQRQLLGLNGWQLSKTCFDAGLASNGSEPLLYHYMGSWNQMEFLHRLFSPSAKQEPANFGATATTLAAAAAAEAAVGAQANQSKLCSKFRGNRQCTVSELLQDCPWVAHSLAPQCAISQLEEMTDHLQVLGGTQGTFARAVWVAGVAAICLFLFGVLAPALVAVRIMAHTRSLRPKLTDLAEVS